MIRTMNKKISEVISALLICGIFFQSAPAAFAADKSEKKVEIVTREVTELPQKYVELIMKEHEKFIKAFANSEMAHRYYFKQIYDAVNRGKKEPTKESLRAMEFQLKLLDRELSACAKRYARNISMARAAMEKMNYEEKTRFAKALSLIFASPAYAFDSSSLSSIEAGLNNIAAGTANIGYENLEDRIRAEAASEAANAKLGEIAASGVCVVTTAGLTIGGVALAVAAAPVVTGVAAGTALFVGGVAGLVGGMLATGDAIIGFVDSITEKETDTRDLKKMAMGFSLLSITSGASGAAAAVEQVKLAVDVADSTKDAWIPLLNEAENPKMPGRAGVADVKNANESSDANSSSEGGGGGCGC